MAKYTQNASGLLIPATIQSDGTALIDGADTSVSVISGKYNNVQPGDRVAVSRIQSRVMVVGSLDTQVGRYYEEWLPTPVTMVSGIHALVGGTQVKLQGAASSKWASSTGKWTCPYTGLYSLCLNVSSGTAGTSTSNRLLITFGINGVSGVALARQDYGGPNYYGGSLVVEHFMNAGDVLYPGYLAAGGFIGTLLTPSALSFRQI